MHASMWGQAAHNSGSGEGFEGGRNARADTDLVDDEELVGVEEALEQEEEGGMKLEPFNLAQERAEGFFDEGGHYVEKKDEDEDEKDAWFASAKGAQRLFWLPPQLERALRLWLCCTWADVCVIPKGKQMEIEMKQLG
jgi:hypothetical protein